MADFPASIFEPRTTENQPGITYDPTKTKIQFAEDYSLPAAEVAAIESTLGINPQGAYATVAAWLAALQAGSGGSAAVALSDLKPSADVDITGYHSATVVGEFEIASGNVCVIEVGGVLAVI